MKAVKVTRWMATLAIVIAFIGGTAHSQVRTSTSSNRSSGSSSSAKPPPRPPPACKPYKVYGPPSDFAANDCFCSCTQLGPDGQPVDKKFRGEGGAVACELNGWSCIAHCVERGDEDAKGWACQQARALLRPPVCESPCQLKSPKVVDASNFALDLFTDNFPTCHLIIEGQCG